MTFYSIFSKLLPNISLAGLALRQWVRPTFSGAAAIALTGNLASPALADPPPPTEKLPPVFCFRITDIEQTDGDNFLFEFQVLNWTDQEAEDVSISLTSRSDLSFSGASVTPETDLPATPPGNIEKYNNWDVTNSGTTAIQWNADSSTNEKTYGPIPNIDLLGPPQLTSDTIVDLIPSYNPVDPETWDNGNNVLGGFKFEVDKFQEGKVLSFDWLLGDKNGIPIGNTMGFGIINIARADAQGNMPDPVFPELGNTGFQQRKQDFAPNTLNNNGDLVNTVNGDLVNTVKDSQGDVVATFGIEIGVGVSSHSIPEPRNLSHSIPEPGNLLGLGFTTFGLLAFGRKIGKQR
jgi:hypothetical protein